MMDFQAAPGWGTLIHHGESMSQEAMPSQRLARPRSKNSSCDRM